MRILFLGDVFAKSGRNAVVERLPLLKADYNCDFVIVNGENAAHGKGITKKIYQSLMDAGADVVTLGNHAFSKSEIKESIETCASLVFPKNIEHEGNVPSYIIKEVKGKKVAVTNILGQVFMDCATTSPLEAMEDLLDEIDADIIIVDLHAEATSEKELFLRVYAHEVTAVIGTHTHVQTADEKIFEGCAFISDVGMCGPYDSVIGRDAEEIIRKIIKNEKTHFTPGDGEAIICGCVIDIDDETNRATNIIRIQERPV